MEQRKLIQHGLSSLTVALPSKWLKDRGIKKGETISIAEEGNKLILSTEQIKKLNKITTDVTKLDRTSTILYIQSLYRFGYDEIEVRFQNPTTTYYRTGEDVSYSSIVNKIVNRLIGAEIVDQTENKVLIKYLTKEAGEDFKVVLRRAFLLMKEAAETLLDGIKQNNMNAIETIEDMHDNVNKFVNYSLRLLNKYGYPDVKKTCFYYHIIASIDKVMDVLKYNARTILKTKQKFSKDSVKIMEDVNISVNIYYKMFYNYDMKLVNELEKNRQNVKSQIRKVLKSVSREEIKYLTSTKQILEIILDLADARMGLEY